MPYAEVSAFVARLRQAAPSASNLALEFTILTAARSGETMGATWAEIDLSHQLWIVPPERMKAGKEHRVPLTGRAIQILEAAREWSSAGALSGYVFPGGRAGQPLSVMALAMALRRAGGGDHTVHGFRSSFRDWCGDETSYPREVAEAALAHSIRDASEAAYRRATALEKRRGLMVFWESYLTPGARRQGVPLKNSKK
jgi:integrase